MQKRCQLVNVDVDVDCQFEQGENPCPKLPLTDSFRETTFYDSVDVIDISNVKHNINNINKAIANSIKEFFITHETERAKDFNYLFCFIYRGYQ